MSISTKKLLFGRFSHFSFLDFLEGKFLVPYKKITFFLQTNLSLRTIRAPGFPSGCLVCSAFDISNRISPSLPIYIGRFFTPTHKECWFFLGVIDPESEPQKSKINEHHIQKGVE